LGVTSIATLIAAMMNAANPGARVTAGVRGFRQRVGLLGDDRYHVWPDYAWWT